MKNDIWNLSKNTLFFVDHDDIFDHIYTDPHFQRKMFMSMILIRKRGLDEMIVQVRGYDRRSINKVIIDKE